MFCADYIAAFIFHGLSTVGGTHLATLAGGGHPYFATLQRFLPLNGKQADQLMTCVSAALGLQHHKGSRCVKSSHGSMAPLAFGAASGIGASLTLYPFDFVRGGVLVGSSLRQR